MNASDVLVETSAFEAAHGKAPRGFGWWFFSPARGCDMNAPHFQGVGKFADVKAAAKKWAAKNGFGTLHVGS